MLSNNTKHLILYLIIQIYCSIGEYMEASTIHVSSLQSLGFKIPEGKFKILLTRLKYELQLKIASIRSHLPSVFKNTVR